MAIDLSVSPRTSPSQSGKGSAGVMFVNVQFAHQLHNTTDFLRHSNGLGLDCRGPDNLKRCRFFWGRLVAQRPTEPEIDRLQKFRAMAAEAREVADNAKTPQMRQEYENLVRAWDQLILEM